MTRARIAVAVVVLSFLAGASPAADLPVGAATGLVVKANASVVIVRPRGPDGKFGSALTLKVRGTSKVWTLVAQSRGGQTVLTQRDTDPKALQPNQTIAVVYAALPDEYVLLQAVAHPLPEK